MTTDPAAPPEYSAGDPLANLAAVSRRLDSLRRFLSENASLPRQQSEQVNAELTSAIHATIINAAALLSHSSPAPIEDRRSSGGGGGEEEEEEEIVEMDAVELMAEHVHTCEICGKGFKRDANLRMHMRAHGDRFKSPESLSKPPPTEGQQNHPSAAGAGRNLRFSCPYAGCNRNKHHRSFRPLKSVVCVKNHFKRSHCPKMYQCSRCNKKSFSVMADLKNHLKHCHAHGGAAAASERWRCSCGTTFSRKDKLFGHVALFEDGHVPAFGSAADLASTSSSSSAAAAATAEEDDNHAGNNQGAEMLVDELMEGFDDESYCLQEMLIGTSSSPSSASSLNVMDFFNF